MPYNLKCPYEIKVDPEIKELYLCNRPFPRECEDLLCLAGGSYCRRGFDRVIKIGENIPTKDF